MTFSPRSAIVRSSSALLGLTVGRFSSEHGGFEVPNCQFCSGEEPADLPEILTQLLGSLFGGEQQLDEAREVIIRQLRSALVSPNSLRDTFQRSSRSSLEVSVKGSSDLTGVDVRQPGSG